MALNTLTMVFGASETPSTLTLSNVKTLMAAADDPNIDMVLGGYVSVIDGIKESEKETLEGKGLHIVNTNINLDSYNIFAQNANIYEGGTTKINATISTSNLIFSIANVQVVSGTIPMLTVQNRVHLNGNTLTIDEADENSSWTARITISAHPTWSETNIATCSLTVSAIAVESLEISGPEEVAANGSGSYTVSVVPAVNTKTTPSYSWSVSEGSISPTGSFIASTDAASVDITVTGSFYGTSITGTKKVNIGQNALDNNTQNPRVFEVVKRVMGLPEYTESLTTMDLATVDNEHMQMIWDELRFVGTQAEPITFDEFKYFTGVTTLTSSDTTMIHITSLKFPASLKNIEGSVFTFNGSLMSSVDMSEFGNNSIDLYGNVFQGSTVKHIDLKNVKNVYFGGLNLSIGYGLCYGCSQLESINWRSISNWNQVKSNSGLRGGHFQDCTRLEKVYSDGFESYTLNGGFFYNCPSLTGVYTQSNVLIDNFVERVSNTNMTNTFYNCQLLPIPAINQAIEVLGDSVFYNCTSATFDHVLPYLYSIGQAFNGASFTFALGVFNFGGSSSATTVTLPRSQFTPQGVNYVKLGHKQARTLTKTNDSEFTANYSNVQTLDATACTKLKSVSYSVLYAMRNGTVKFNTTAVPVLSGYNPDYGLGSTCKIVVPASLFSAWKAADNWNQIAANIVAE